jgi:hypothetical protein
MRDIIRTEMMDCRTEWITFGSDRRRTAMMNDLINTVSEKTGLGADRAQAAVDAVLGLLKQRLPSPVADVLTSLVHEDEGRAAAAGAEGSGESGGAALAGEAEALLGNLFGSKKESN